MEHDPPPPLVRVQYTSRDGWSAPLFYAPPAPGGSGEPVLIAHALGLGPDAYRYGGSDTLVGALTRAGFAVYLLTHRGDSTSVGSGRDHAADFDGIVSADVPAALAAVRTHSGFPEVHWVGHGLGGQLGLVGASRDSSGVATVCAIGAPVRFPGVRSEFRARHLALRLVPGHWRVPLRSAASWAAPVSGDGVGIVVPAARARGVMSFGSEDFPVAMLQQLMTWVREGRLTSRDGRVDWTAGLACGRVPLRVVAGEGDPIWAPAYTEAAAEIWAGEVEVQRVPGWTHLDAVLGSHADERVHGPLVRWLVARRRLAWGAGWSRSCRGL
ncbi:MAG: pimeloyl-ACP methyl ester carboxylesterase [Myxococcota bacterium]